MNAMQSVFAPYV